jgi:hypothetical protein
MGSLKQATTLAMLHNRARVRRNQNRMTPDEEQRFRAGVIAADLQTIRGWFDEVNAELNFDRKTSHATSEQLQVIRTRERRAFGEARTSFRDALTFEEAHKRIQSLKGADRA